MDLFFLLLRYSIGASDVVPQEISDTEWERIYGLSTMHSLQGIVFWGIQQSGLRPPFWILMRWIADDEVIKASNKKANHTAVVLSQLMNEEGFETCILKGQGNTLSYPSPYIRVCGDIDIWLEGGRKKIMRMVDECWPGQVLRYHHVEIPKVDGIPVEVHFMPSYMSNPIRNRRLQRWFAQNKQRQFEHKVTLPEQKEQVCVPTTEFNIMFQLQHMFSHLFTEGFGLRQVVDYYYVLKSQDKDTCKKGDIGRTLRYLGLRKFAGAMMWIMQEMLCLDESYIIVEPDEKEGKFILNEILHSGNMGYYDTRLGDKTGEGVIHRYFRMTRRDMRFICHYPSEALFEPLFRTYCFFRRVLHV